MDFLITCVASNLASFVHEMVNNNCKDQERREIDYLCSEKTQPGMNSPLAKAAHWFLLLLHLWGFQRKLVYNYYQLEVADFQP